MNTIFCTVDSITEVLAAGYTHIRVYTDDSETGDFTTLDGTIELAAGTESYTHTDVDGTVDTWYKTAFYGAVPDEGDQTSARKSDTSAAYASVEEYRAHTGLSKHTDDVELALLLDSAARSINRYCNRPDGFIAPPNPTTRYYSSLGGAWQLIDECVEIETVSVKDSPSDASYVAWTTPTSNFAGDGDWVPFGGHPERPQFNRLPFTGIMIDPNGDYSSFTSGKYTGRRGFRPSVVATRGIPTVSVSARWGYSTTIPVDIKLADLMQAARWYKRLHGGMADAMASPEIGGRMRFVRRLDPDIALLLRDGRYKKPALG